MSLYTRNPAAILERADDARRERPIADYLIGNPQPNLTTGVEAMGGYGEVSKCRALYLHAGVRVWWLRSEAKGRSSREVAEALERVCGAFAFGTTQSRAVGRWVRLDLPRLLEDDARLYPAGIDTDTED